MLNHFHSIQYLRFCGIIGCQPSPDLWCMYYVAWCAGRDGVTLVQRASALLAPTAPPTTLTKYIIFCQGLVVAEGVR